MRCPIGMTVLNRRRLPGLFARTAGLACVVAAAGCSGGGTTSAQPPWVGSLGSGVTVKIPRPTASGSTSPASVVQAYVEAINDGKLTALCQLVEPAAQGACQQALAGSPPTGSSSFSDFALGYVATRGDKALVGLTATHCSPQEKPTCSTNKDRAAIFSSDRTFDALYADATRALSPGNTDNRYSLVPCVRVGSAWYLYLPPADF